MLDLPSRASAALRTPPPPPPPAGSAPGGEVPKNVLKAAADGRVGTVRLWLNEGGKPSKASKVQARLEYSPSSQKWTVFDSQSANGTFVNGK